MKTTVYLVRHGETEWNTLGKFQGCTDIALSEKGYLQAKMLSQRFKDNFDYVFSSPLIRALKTAEILSKNKGVSPIIEPNFREINFGEWEGLTLGEIEKYYPEQFNNWRNDKVEGLLCGGDYSIQNASKRGASAVINIAKAYPNKTLIIIGHGGIIKAALIEIFNWDMTMYHKMFLDNTAVTKITFDSGFRPRILSLNDTSHLSVQAD